MKIALVDTRFRSVGFAEVVGFDRPLKVIECAGRFYERNGFTTGNVMRYVEFAPVKVEMRDEL